jgi:hypothetical protein
MDGMRIESMAVVSAVEGRETREDHVETNAE